VGGGWTDESIAEMRNADSVMGSVPYVHPGAEFMAAQQGPPAAESIAEHLRATLAKHGLGTCEMKNQVYSF